MLGRRQDLATIRSLLKLYPVVAILGARQVGKTTVARELSRARNPGSTLFDLENSRDAGKLADAATALEALRGLVILDEVQRAPEIFAQLRWLADRPRVPARFLVLGSSSPALLRQSSESLAGRIAFHHLSGFSIEDVGVKDWKKLWIRGGFPRSFLARTEAASFAWRKNFIQTFVERDIPRLGFTISADTLERFWTMLAHYHGQIWNSAELAKAFALSDKTVKSYMDILRDTFMVRVLRPFSENVGKRVVKSPKVYIQDSGILHGLLGLSTLGDLESHPKLGYSFEGFAIDQIARRLGADPRDCYFWATHQGAELDLLVVHGRKRLGFEIKCTKAPSVTKSTKIAIEDLKLDSLDIVHLGDETYSLTQKVRAVSISRLRQDLKQLS